MNCMATSDLEQLLRQCDLGWMIDWHEDRRATIASLKKTLENATAESQRRFGSRAATFSEPVLAAEYQENPHKVRAFLEALGATSNPKMLVMVWRILQGASIAKLNVAYEDRKYFDLHIVLELPYGDGTDAYESSDISDAALLRHFGIATLDNKPVFDGFYPLHIP